MTRPVRSSLVALLVLLLAGAAGWAARPWSTPATPPLTAALSTVPQSASLVGFTNWRQLGSAPVADDDLNGRDLSTRSELHGSSAAMSEALGWSVADLEWELLAQGGAVGAGVLVAQLDAGTSASAVDDGFSDAGFEASGNAWESTTTQLNGAGLSTIMQHVRVLEREGLVVMSQSAPAAEAVVDVVRGGATAITRDRAFVDVATTLAGSDAVLLERLGLGCRATGMPDEESQQQADVALEPHGTLEEYDASGRGITAGRDDVQHLTFAMRFGDPQTARDQREVREPVATGPFIGRTGTIDEALRLDSSSTDGATLTMRFEHEPDQGVFMTGFGPLLFASC